MSFAPTHTITADLNGTGTFVDITAYVSLDAGIGHEWGRTDWTSAVPSPGSLTLTLENNDGRFTPGNTAVYTVGCVVGCGVRWTVGARTRSFTMSVPSLSFPSGVQGQSLVTVRCFDALQGMAQHKMRSMMDEEILSATNGAAAALWPLNDAAGRATTLIGVPTHVAPQDVASSFGDVSANAELPLVPWNGDPSRPSTDFGTIPTGAMGFAAQGGAPLGTGQCLRFWPGVTTPPLSYDFGLQTAPGMKATAAGCANTGGGFTNYNITTHSFWFQIDDIYGVENTAAGGFDGPFVCIAYLGELGNVRIYWQVKFRRLYYVYIKDSTTRTVLVGSNRIEPGKLYHFTHTTSLDAGSAAWVNYRWVSLNGVESTVSNTWTSTAKMLGDPAAFMLGANPAQVTTTLTGGASDILYGFVGTMSHVSLHTSPAVVMTGFGTFTHQGNFNTEAYPLGTTGIAEDSETRTDRLMDYAGRTGTLLPNGSSAPYQLTTQDTAGATLLTAVCDALRADEACLDTVRSGGADWVRPQLSSVQRAYTPEVIIDVSADTQGVPVLSFDGSGVAVDVTAKNRAVSVRFVDTAADTRWTGTSASITCALDVAGMGELAQFRAQAGRITQCVPNQVVVDAGTSKNDLTTALIALRPGSTVRLSGFPSAIVGYSTIDCSVIGVTEHYGLGRAFYTLRLEPNLAALAGFVDPALGTEGPWRPTKIVPSDGLLNAGGSAISDSSSSMTSGFTNVATSLWFWSAAGPSGTDPAGATPLSSAAGDYPMQIRYGTEVLGIASAPAAPTLVAGGACKQAITVTRGQAGTAATSHGFVVNLDPFEVVQVGGAAVVEAYISF